MEPSFSPSLTYKELEYHGYIGITKQLQILGSLETAGFLTREKSHYAVLLKCDVCGSSNFSLTPSCIVCGSGAMEHGAVIEHHRCGNVDLAEKYISPSGDSNVLVCPKCGKKLNALGVDYSRPGPYFKCTSCGALVPGMETKCTCVSCGNSANISSLDSIQIPVYLVNLEKLAEAMQKESGQQDLTQHPETNYLVSVAQLLKEMKLDCAAPGRIQGISNVYHTFDLVLYDQNKQLSLVADIARTAIIRNTSEKGRIEDSGTKEVQALLAFYAKCMDLYFRNKKLVTRVLFTQSELGDDAKRLAEAYGVMNLVVSNPSDMQEHKASMIAQFLAGILQR